MHYSVPTETVILMEDQKFNYLLFCSKVFKLVKSVNGDRFFEHSPIGARVYEFHFVDIVHVDFRNQKWLYLKAKIVFE